MGPRLTRAHPHGCDLSGVVDTEDSPTRSEVGAGRTLIVRTLRNRPRPSALAVLMVLMACGAPSAGRSEIVVSAASSLSDAFTEIAEAFEASNPDVAITLNVGGSSSLREQILEGAAVDVFASADSRNVEDVSGELVGPARVFARNVLQIGVPSGNPANVAGLEDFERSDLLLGVCANSVPCGDLAERVLAAAGVEALVDTYEPNVRALAGEDRGGRARRRSGLRNRRGIICGCGWPLCRRGARFRLLDRPARRILRGVGLHRTSSSPMPVDRSSSATGLYCHERAWPDQASQGHLRGWCGRPGDRCCADDRPAGENSVVRPRRSVGL